MGQPRRRCCFASCFPHRCHQTNAGGHVCLSTAEQARVIGSKNPCGLFAELIRRKLWHSVTESDEDATSARLKQHLYGRDPRCRPALPIVAEPPELSKDTAIVRHLQTQLARAGFHGKVCGFGSREDPPWTREHWGKAVLEVSVVNQGQNTPAQSAQRSDTRGAAWADGLAGSPCDEGTGRKAMMRRQSPPCRGARQGDVTLKTPMASWRGWQQGCPKTFSYQDG